MESGADENGIEWHSGYALNGRRTLERVLNGRSEKVFAIKCH